ncbi:MAG: thioredoxin family protein [Planctomycetaceae bacterium]
MLRLLALPILLALALPAVAGKYNPTLSVGDVGPAWEALPGVDDKPLAFDDLKEAKVVVLAFTCNTCPYAVDAEKRLVALAKTFADDPVRLVAINCNRGDRDSLDAMQARAKEAGFGFAYLKDDAGVGKAYGALRTPEFVVLDAERKVVYLGALDDDPDGKAVTKRYVEEAVRAALANEAPAINETPPIGCLVKYPRDRRR